MMQTLWQDIRYGVRTLVASPGFAAIAILSLAIGVGANCAIFSFADALLLRPLPVARPGEVFTVGSTTSVEAFGASSLISSYPDYVDIRDRSKTFDGLAAFDYVTAGVAAKADGTPKLKMGMLVSGNFFSVTRVQPVLGRTIAQADDQVPGRDAVVMLGHVMWEQEFASDPSVIGRHVSIDGHPFSVIGVVPADFTGMDQFVRADFFVPLMMSAQILTDPKAASLQARDARNLTLKGRLTPGVGQATAQAELTTIGSDLERAYPATNKNRRFAIRTELQARMAQDPPDATLVAMLGTLAIAVLLVACANVAGLLTSRAPARAKEMALRLAIGAGRGRLIRQLITESLLISIAAGFAGLGVGYAGMRAFRTIQIPTDLPIVLAFRMDRRALLFSLAIAVASTLLFGLSPAVQAARTDLTAVMKAGEGAAPGSRRRWGRAILVCGQVAVSVVVLTIAVFMYRGFSRELAGGPGYRTDHLLIMHFDTSLVHYTDAQSEQFYKDVADRARTQPGVSNVSLTTAIPMDNDSVGSATVVPEGFQFPPGKDNATVLSTRIDEHYFDTIGLTIVSGRNFRIDDASGAPLVGIVNEQFAKHYWPNQDPIGKRFRLVGAGNTWVQVVGLAKTSKYLFIAEPPTDFVYLPYRQRPPRRMAMLVASAGDPAALAAPLREAVRSLDPNLPIFNVRTMANLYEMRATNIFRVLVGTVLTLGLMGLALAIVGLYGLVAYAASRRTREIGIRMAIGADRIAVLRMVLRQGLTLALVGLVVGLAASIGAGRILNAAFAMSTSEQRDFGAFIIVIAVVLAVTFVAAYVPARRASRVNPMLALRHD
jgi:putative ABC transport system permease protein